ncbi:uncharacterized protein LOC143145489 [Ptiloglossa arizonensis]|uniref:uncharacterized protein LOC143145489 n=1 Tax=Ptiloglossa arizonensis TaxID=3350558 RepID=UPI003F9FDE57
MFYCRRDKYYCKLHYCKRGGSVEEREGRRKGRERKLWKGTKIYDWLGLVSLRGWRVNRLFQEGSYCWQMCTHRGFATRLYEFNFNLYQDYFALHWHDKLPPIGNYERFGALLSRIDESLYMTLPRQRKMVIRFLKFPNELDSPLFK